MGSLRAFLSGRLQRNAILLLAAQSFYKLTGFVLLPLLSHRLPEKDVGVYFFALSFAATFSIISNLNLSRLMMRRVAEDPERAAEHLAPLSTLRLATIPLYLLTVLAAALLSSPEIWSIIAVVALCTVIEDVYFLHAGYFIARERVILNVVIGVTTQTLYLTGCVIVLWLAPSLAAFLALNLARSLIMALATVWATGRFLERHEFRWDLGVIREGAPFLLIGVLNLLRRNIDALLLGFLISYETVGHYQLALRVVQASLFIPLAVGSAFFPQLAARRLDAANRRALLGGVGALAGVGVVGAAIAAIAAVPLATVLFGPVAASVAPLLRWLGLLLPLAFLDRFLGSALQALGQERLVLRASVLATIASVAGNCVLIPLLGSFGAVWAILVSTLIRMSILAACLSRQYSLTPAQSISIDPGKFSSEGNDQS